jgi:predicted small metal-binding protein
MTLVECVMQGASPVIGTKKMTLNLNCKDAGDPVCTHTMYGETEEELLQNAKKHGMEVHGYTEQSWNEVTKNTEHFRKIIKKNG